VHDWEPLHFHGLVAKPILVPGNPHPPRCAQNPLPQCARLSGALNSIARLGSRQPKLCPRTRAPLRPSGGRGRGPTPTGPRDARAEDRLRVGRVRWAAPQTGSSVPLTLPSPPGRRGETVKRAPLEPTLAATLFKHCPSTISGQPYAVRARVCPDTKCGVAPLAPGRADLRMSALSRRSAFTLCEREPRVEYRPLPPGCPRSRARREGRDYVR
jgi:hypothetical protein